MRHDNLFVPDDDDDDDDDGMGAIVGLLNVVAGLVCAVSVAGLLWLCLAAFQ